MEWGKDLVFVNVSSEMNGQTQNKLFDVANDDRIGHGGKEGRWCRQERMEATKKPKRRVKP